MWLTSASYRLFRVLYYGRRASVLEIWEGTPVLRITARTRRPIRPFPGAYFKLSFSNVRRSFLGSWDVTPIWYDTTGSFTTDITFLLQAPAAKALQHRTLTLEGPLGHDIGLNRYETVLLVAKGVGIAGVLSHAYSLAYRRHQDERAKKAQRETDGQSKISILHSDRTRKVDIFWKLEYNSQE